MRKFAEYKPSEFVTNHLDIDLFAHAEPQASNEGFVNPRFELTHPMLVRLEVEGTFAFHLPEGSLGVAARSRLGLWRTHVVGRSRELATSALDRLHLMLNWGSRDGLSIAILTLLRWETFVILKAHDELQSRY
jgi:hypothetical protein